MHDPFEGFELVDFALRDALAPRQSECLLHGAVVALNSSHEALEFRNATAGGFLHPGTELLSLALAHHVQEGV